MNGSRGDGGMVVQVSSLAEPGLAPYRSLRAGALHHSAGMFVAEGEKVVRRLLASDIHIVSFLLTSAWLETLRVQIAQRAPGATIFLADDSLLDSIIGIQLHKRLMAIGKIPEAVPFHSLSKSGGSIHVALEGIADAENMGMIIRNCAAFGVRSLMVGSDSCSPWLRRSVRVSVGTIFSLPIHTSGDILETLGSARREGGWRVVGTTPHGGETDARDLLRRLRAENTVLLFGSEASGLSDRARGICDALYTLPMSGAIDSINVANAVAVVVHDVLRSAGGNIKNLEHGSS